MSGRTLTRGEVMEWSSLWSYTDRETIEFHLDRLDTRTYYVPPSGGYIGCRDDAGVRVLFIHPGYLTFRVGDAPVDRPEGWDRSVPLSTFAGHASPLYEPQFNERFCDIHNLSIPSSRDTCEFCDD